MVAHIFLEFSLVVWRDCCVEVFSGPSLPKVPQTAEWTWPVTVAGEISGPKSHESVEKFWQRGLLRYWDFTEILSRQAQTFTGVSLHHAHRYRDIEPSCCNAADESAEAAVASNCSWSLKTWAKQLFRHALSLSQSGGVLRTDSACAGKEQNTKTRKEHQSGHFHFCKAVRTESIECDPIIYHEVPGGCMYRQRHIESWTSVIFWYQFAAQTCC